MAGSYSKNIPSNGFLSLPIESKASNSKRGRSVSNAGSDQSARSSLSRITYVEEDSQIAAYSDLEDSDSIVQINYSCLDRLAVLIRILFCLPISLKMKKKRSPKHVEALPFDTESSPWLLSVFVLSTRKDSNKQPVPKNAKCTIDTGNMQGNIVSRDFVENVLEYSEANFVRLTAEEMEGGFGITGDKLVPEGAIYLTWYHSKSTRVFHSMRFLISPHSQCDLIIGARSILKDNLLGVPNLMATVTTTAKIAPIDNPKKDKEEEELNKTLLKRKKIYEEKEVALLEAGEDTENDNNLKKLGEDCDIARNLLLIRQAELKNNQNLVIQLKKDLEKLPGYNSYVVPSKAHAVISSGLETKNDVVVQRAGNFKKNSTSSPKR
ncbi:hypothetical protein BCIN_10g01760 [Botrytis cinerea B05.10]|uniref:Uncharacterized protein n=2 Tax=Botryotinia fuckeliana TaxID=40559 RepID=A0A384JU90_BOTFB|nr:hypothetical protein BCIN_10g01760 [Botrytis cinerea B05.10]ATZ54156.1 hypothetical protein BCIN_10g01760 [Botrytis cinerea B05.10]EMR81045.1 hypothetical protein BcDW1_10356 [Botrytis cinerea BcDW1]